MCNARNRWTVMRSEVPLHDGATKASGPLVVSCGCNSLQRARLHDALRGIAQLRLLAPLGTVAIADAFRVPDVFVIAIEPVADRDYVALVRETRRRYPKTALVAYCGAVADTPASIGALAA